jgi:hypothetical protein
MALDSAFGVLNFVAGAVAGVGLLYLLTSESVAVTYGRFFRVVIAGLLVFAVTGPFIGSFAPAVIHGVHALAAAFIAAGLALLLSGDGQADDFEAAFRGP